MATADLTESVFYEGLEIKAPEDVYAPAEDSFLLAANQGVRDGDLVLDLGTGSGIQALVAARRAEKVVAVDLNPSALSAARENAAENGVKNIEFQEGDLFSAIGKEELFDVILFNPPYLPAEEYDALGKAWSGGPNGMDAINRFLKEAPSHLKRGGRIRMIASSLNDLAAIEAAVRRQELAYSVAASAKVWFEELYVVSAESRL